MNDLIERFPGVWVHPTAVVDLPVSIGEGTRIWHFCHLMAGARLGTQTSLGQGCFVASTAVIGSGVKVQNQVSLYDGVVLEDQVFIGPNAVFTNVRNPRAFVSRRTEYQLTCVGQGATVGANATILPGCRLGAYCFVAAGAVVTRDVPDFALVMGCPARVVGAMSRHGERLDFDSQGRAVCSATGERYQRNADGAIQRSEG